MRVARAFDSRHAWISHWTHAVSEPMLKTSHIGDLVVRFATKMYHVHTCICGLSQKNIGDSREKKKSPKRMHFAIFNVF